MPKTLEKYIEEFGNHLRRRDKSEKTVQGYCIGVKQLLCDSVGMSDKWEIKRYPERLKFSDIEDFAYKLRKAYEPNTQKIKLSGIKRYLKFIKKTYGNNLYNEYIVDKEETEDILKADTPQDKKVDIITKDEVKMFFDASEENPRDNAIFKTFYYSTQRLYSVQNLNTEDIDFSLRKTIDGNKYYNITFRYQKGKSKKFKVVPVEPELIDAIKTYLGMREEPDTDGFIYDNYGNKLYHRDAIFLNGTGQRFTCMGIYNMVKRYAVRLGIKKRIYPHLWRHTAITLMDKAGLSDAEIKQKTGHSKLSNALNIYKDPQTDDIVSKTQDALVLDAKPQYKPEPIRHNDDNVDIRIKELELELLKLKEAKSKEQVDKLNYYG